MQNASCASTANVFQWSYNNDGCGNDEWLFEPVYNYSPALGAAYARANYLERSTTFPAVDALGGDCANFASQAMLAGGVHYQGSWGVYKKNHTYLAPQNVSQLNNSRTLSDPSPWINAKQFNTFWSSRVRTETYTGQYILDHSSEIFNRPFYIGDVIQILNGSTGSHTMYITGYSSYNGKSSLSLTYHSTNAKDKNLLEIAADYRTYNFRFFTII